MNYTTNLLSLKDSVENNGLTIDDIKTFINLPKIMDDLENLHLFLINEILAIHKKEESCVNNHLCKTFLNAEHALDKGEDAKSGGKIYFFNNITSTYYIFGDIHGDSYSIIEFLKTLNFIDKVQRDENLKIIFLGDYIDRGHCVFKALELILVLKYLFPHNIFLLRGNHDGGTIISEKEYKLCVGRNSGTTDEDYFVASLFNRLTALDKPLTLFESYLTLFESLCTLALIKNGDDVVLCVHGGIPRAKNSSYEHLNLLGDLYDESITDHIGRTILHNMLWSDPSEDTTLQRDGGRFYFYNYEFENFLNRFSMSMVIRGHQAFDEGYKEFFNGKLLSIFSSGSSSSKNKETAYPSLSPCVVELHHGENSIIRLQN